MIVEGVLKVQPGVAVKVVNPAKPGTRTADAAPAKPAAERTR